MWRGLTRLTDIGLGFDHQPARIPAILAVEGCCRPRLADVVPAYAHWQLADMPRYLSAEQVSRLIAACDGDAVARRRDRAIMLLLARPGLRAGDVAQLRFADGAA